MPEIYKHPDWPNFRWDRAALAERLAAVRHRQGRLLGRMNGLGITLRREASLEALTGDVLKTSAIEGELLDRDEVRSSIARRLGVDVAGLKPSSREVDGVVEMMLDATQNYNRPLDPDRLFGWHNLLFPAGRSGMHKITVAGWRTDALGLMQVVSGPIGRERVHYTAPAADRVPGEMARFLDVMERQDNDDPVIKSAVAQLWFLTIHPFDDGNGRIGRAIADMMLARADGCVDRFYSMSSAIEAHRKSYYEILERAQHGTLDITDWLGWYLDTLDAALERAEADLQSVLYKARLWDRVNAAGGANERQTIILNRMMEPDWKGWIATRKYQSLAKCPEHTARRDILDLEERGFLVKNTAGGRSTSYRLLDAETVLEEHDRM